MSAPIEKLTKKQLKADHPTWCPGCGDFAVLASFFNVIQKLGIPHEKIVCVAGIGCSSRFPYFVNTHGIHFIHGRALPLATGISLSRPDLHVFVFGGDGDGYSIGGNHLNHGRRSKTDPRGAIDRPINPMAQLVASGATFIARTHAVQVKHMNEMFERAILHPGFAVVETLSECSMFFPGAFDDGIPRRGGTFELVDESSRDMSSTAEAMALAEETEISAPGKFGVYLEAHRPTKNELENQWLEDAQSKVADLSQKDLLRQKFAAMR